MTAYIWFCSLFLILLQCQFSCPKLVAPPLPLRPLPTVAQLRWQRRELIMFFHFGVNTFTDSEWGTGHESPSVFNPSALNASQWVDAAADAGFSLVILTAKHHDGFCLWPSKYTHHSVASSPWRGGKGDVVRELADAARAHGIDMGLYLSPWDRHERFYGVEVEYNEFYLAQLQELLTGYGSVSEIWFDGAKGPNAPNMTYHFDDWFATVKELQGSINIFSDAGPDVRWVGDEAGSAGATCWSSINRTSLRIGDSSEVGYLNTGDPRGTDWVPPECDVSIRKGWFWHKSQTPKPLSQLLDIYYNSVGRNCVLLLNVPPNSSGLISDVDIKRLKEFHVAIRTIFSANLAGGSTAKASSQRGGEDGGFAARNVLEDDDTYWAPSERDGGGGGAGYWVELANLDRNVSFNVVRLQEPIGMGQRIRRHEVYADGKVVARGTTVGHKRLHRLERAVRARKVRVRIAESRGVPLVSAVGLHFDPYMRQGMWRSTATTMNGTRTNPSNFSV